MRSITRSRASFYTPVLRLEALDDSDPRKEDLRFVIEDANRCREIVKDLLTYSRQTNPNKEILQLNDLVCQSLGLIRDRKLFMQVNVVKELSDEMMPIQGDRNQLSQVIINLVLNAIDAMERVGTLTLRTYRDPTEAKVYLEVSDTGCWHSDRKIFRKYSIPFLRPRNPERALASA